MAAPISVHVWSDVACPWCFIGKRRFEKAIEMFDGEVELEYHSFLLAPETPVDFDGNEIEFLASYKRIPVEQVKSMIDNVRQIATSEGLLYDFETLQHTNSILAHQAIHFAKAQGKQLELVERIFHAYFEQGRHVGRIDDLVQLASDVDLDGQALRAALETGEFKAAVDVDLATASRIGINGVPFYVINEKFGVSGAQSPETFLEVLHEAANT